MKTLHTTKGISLVEVLISIGIFSILSVIAYQVFINSGELVDLENQKNKAIWLAEEGLEATRSIRSEDFDLLTSGTHGIQISSNKWVLNGSSDVIDGYTRTVQISPISSDTKQIQATVSWFQKGIQKEYSLITTLTDWQSDAVITGTQADGLTIDTTNARVLSTGGRRDLSGITLSTNGSVATTTITSVQVTLTGSTRNLQRVESPNGTIVWTGNVPSGTTVTLTNPIVLVGATSRTFQLRFSGAINGVTNVTIVYTMSDGSTKSVSIPNPPTI